MLSEEREAKKEFGIPAGSPEEAGQREGPLPNSGRRLAAGVSIPQP
ncbi:MAG: hypothetical protein U5K69_22645 [Balneolaceae bacterium]|nr:hypothetical protein [Balneolaceae bacterium]